MTTKRNEEWRSGKGYIEKRETESLPRFVDDDVYLNTGQEVRDMAHWAVPDDYDVIKNVHRHAWGSAEDGE